MQWYSWWISVKSVKCINAHVWIFLERIISYCFVMMCSPCMSNVLPPCMMRMIMCAPRCVNFWKPSILGGWCVARDDYNVQFFLTEIISWFSEIILCSFSFFGLEMLKFIWGCSFDFCNSTRFLFTTTHMH